MTANRPELNVVREGYLPISGYPRQPTAPESTTRIANHESRQPRIAVSGPENESEPCPDRLSRRAIAEHCFVVSHSGLFIQGYPHAQSSINSAPNKPHQFPVAAVNGFSSALSALACF